MFAPRYFAPRMFAPRYFPPGVGVGIDEFQGTYIDRFKEIAYQEDEEFLLLLRAIIKVIDPWH